MLPDTIFTMINVHKKITNTTNILQIPAASFLRVKVAQTWTGNRGFKTSESFNDLLLSLTNHAIRNALFRPTHPYITSSHNFSPEEEDKKFFSDMLVVVLYFLSSTQKKVQPI